VADSNYEFKAVPTFWKAFNELSAEQKDSARNAFKTFKSDPFHRSLKTHKINRLTALMKRAVYAVVIEGNLRAVFVVKGNQVISFDIGTHDIYK